jgi:hypothetical protein
MGIQAVFGRGANVADQYPEVEREPLTTPQHIHHGDESGGFVAVQEARDQPCPRPESRARSRDPDERRFACQPDKDLIVRPVQ